jgi:hypothetical protein
MSAFVVDDAHIDVLLDLATQFGATTRTHCLRWLVMTPEIHFNRLDRQPLTDVGRMLLAENAASVGERYDELQQPVALTYLYRPTRRQFTPNQALKALDCYEYQACEHAAWEASESASFCRALRAAIVSNAIPQSKHDPWEWTDSDLGRAEQRYSDHSVSSIS